MSRNATSSTHRRPPGSLPVASFHLIRHGSRLRALTHLAMGRRQLAATPGLDFWRLLGTGSGSDTGPGADLSRTAVFAMWRDEGDLDRFVATGPVDAVEHWHVRLRARGGHGSWKGRAVIDELAPAPTLGGSTGSVGAAGAADPVAIITRAHVHMRHWRRFRAAGPAVSAELQSAPGLLAVVGIGEAPAGNLGTFSLWRSGADAVAFAREQPHHREVIRRTRAEGWYGEELFARFEPFRSAGLWDGRDPLA